MSEEEHPKKITWSEMMQKVETIWQMFDRDGNGYLDENEFFLFSAHNGNNFPRE